MHKEVSWHKHSIAATIAGFLFVLSLCSIPLPFTQGKAFGSIVLQIFVNDLPYTEDNSIYDARQNGSNFTFTLQQDATTSAGVFTKDGVLVRTLWGNVHYNSGVHTVGWNGNDDFGNKLDDGSYDIRVLSGNMQYAWEGVVGNTSTDNTGSTFHHNLRPIADMAFTSSTGYYAAGYGEGNPSALKFAINTPQTKTSIQSVGIETDFVDTDGAYVYWGVLNDNNPSYATHTFVYVTRTSDDSEVALPNSVPYTKIAQHTYTSAIDYVDTANDVISGLAVQKNANYLVTTRAGINQVDILNKTTGALVNRVTTYTAPRSVAFDGDNNLWMAYTKNGSQVVEKFHIGTDGTPVSLGVSLSGLVNPMAVSVSPDNTTVTVADGGNSQQVKAYNVADGSAQWVLGQQGGYANGPDVTNNKFYFSDSNNSIPTVVSGVALPTFIAYQPDGSFWVGDTGNCRSQHYAADKTFINNIAYRPTSYAAHVDPGDPTRLFSDFLEYRIDYSKPLAPNNGSWTLVKNWGYGLPAAVVDKYYGMRPVTFSGHTYTFLSHFQTNPQYLNLYELPASGPLRDTGIQIIAGSTKYLPAGTTLYLAGLRMYPDGSIYNSSRYVSGKASTWTKNTLIGIDGNGNPSWNNYQYIASTPNATNHDPVYQGNYINQRSGEITDSGIVASFAAGVLPGTSDQYHLGGIRLGDSKWLWKTSMSTPASYVGDFPSDGGYDLGNGVKYAGSVALAYGNSIFWGYYGEFWKNMETNKWNQYNDDGLMVGQFGIAGTQYRNVEGVPGMAGNSFASTMVQGTDGNAYLYQNDESQHSGVHRWKITGFNTIHEETIPFTLPYVAAPSSDGSTPVENAPVVTDLMAGLPHSSVLQDGVAGWHRNPTTEILTDRYSNFWSVTTNAKTYGLNNSPDVFVSFRQLPTHSFTVTRDLPTTAPWTLWTLAGNVSYQDTTPNGDKTKFGTDGEGGQFLEVLDDQGKIIVRFYNRYNYDTKSMGIYANNAPVSESTQTLLTPIINLIQPLSIRGENGNITVQYAQFNPVTTVPFDPSANWQKPTTLRLYFWTNVNSSPRLIDLSNVTFTGQ